MEKIGETRSLCPFCLKVVDAEKIVDGDDVYLLKKCMEHGEFKVLIWRGYKSYMERFKFNIRKRKPKSITRLDKGCPLDCGLCPHHKQKTCVTVLEVTSRCNLRCPICFASAGDFGSFHPDLEDIWRMYRLIIENTDKPYVVQISGGEPTVRKDLPEIVSMGKEMGIDYIELNTNGILLAKDLDFLKSLKESGLDALYFSFDGLTSDVYVRRCGIDLLDLKMRVLENCRKIDLSVILVPVIDRDINYHQIGDIISFAKKWVPTVVGVHFQPVAYFGRIGKSPENRDRITIPDILEAIEKQTRGELKEENFTPTSCTNIHCDARSFSILDANNRLLPLTHKDLGVSGNIVDIAEVIRKCICDLWRMPIGNLCSNSTPGSWEEFIELAKTRYLTVSAMAFQDAWTVETDRLEECCIHVVTPTGKLIPFCAFNVSSINGQTLYRHKELNYLNDEY
ncbi:MAG: radical SAM protein [Candidatus Methanomethylicia archaeon]